MLNINNYIYTNKGIYSIANLLELYNASAELPKVMTFDTVEASPTIFEYSFVDIDNILETDNVDIYECKFLDIYSNRNITLNCSFDTQIFQYNTLLTDVDPIINKNFQVIRYLNSNITRTKLTPQWTAISTLINYGTKMTNICLGDTVMKFSNRLYLNKEKAYSFRLSDNSVIPIFASLSNSTYYNFVLVK
jgi:hypothetical protein